MNTIQKLGVLAFLSPLFATAVLAGGHGDISCDPSWRSCVQVMSYDNAGNAIVGGIKTADIPSSVRLPWNGSTQIKIPVGTQNVFVITPDQRSVLIGEITQPIGNDAGTALSRELALANGTSAHFVAGKVYTQESCNATALSPIVYEHTLHRMESDFLVLTQNGGTLPIALNPRDLGTIRTISSPIPCK